MKNAFILLLIILMLAVSAGCDRDTPDVITCYPDTTAVEEKSPSLSRNVSFNAQYVRTNGYHDGVRYPVVTVIHSVDELNDYYEANKDKYNLERRTGTVYSDSTIGFLDACDKYDEKYFENQILLMVLLEEGSGSIRHKVENVSSNDNGVTVDISTVVPEIGTADMAEWHILIEPEAGIDVTSENVIVFINGKNATEKLTEVYHSKGHGNIALTLKEGWEYFVTDEEDSEEFSVTIYPTGHEKNSIRIGYYKSFGVCGTGLRTERIKLGSYDATMGTYDDHRFWDFITLQNTFGDYAIINGGGDEWLEEYEDEVWQILSTLKVSEGYISQAEAVRVAREKANSNEEKPQVEYDSDAQLWKVTLSGDYTNGKDTFVIDVRGNITNIID